LDSGAFVVIVKKAERCPSSSQWFL